MGSCRLDRLFCKGGTLSDLFDEDHRGLPMLAFAFSAFAPTALGPICFGYAGMFKGFRLAAWVQVGSASALTALIVGFQSETREDVILAKIARPMASEEGSRTLESDQSTNLRSFYPLLRTGLRRPFVLLLSEPILQAWTLYVSFACT